MRVLVTGANSLLASNTINILLEKDHKVIGFLRNPRSFPLPAHKNLVLQTGDITDPESYLDLLKDIDSVIHIAALTSQNIIDYEIYKKVNTEATVILYKHAIDNDVSSFIYVSTANCFGYGSSPDLGNELKTSRYPFTKSLYAKSKLEAQQILLQYKTDSQKTKLVILNPTFMIGAYDTKPSSGRLILSGYNKKVIFYPSGGKSFINVKDAANGVVNAITSGRHKEAYILSGTNLSYKAFYKKVVLQLEQNSTLIKIPNFLLISVGYLGDLLRFFNIKTDISSVNVKALCVDNYYTNEKAKKELKLPQNNIDEGISDAIRWFNLI